MRDRDRIGTYATLRLEVRSKSGHVLSRGERVQVKNAWRGTFAVENSAEVFVRRVPRAWLAFDA